MPKQYKSLKRLKVATGGIFTDAWMMDQYISIQTLNRTLFEYDVTYYGSHQIYEPRIPKDNPIRDLKQLSLHYHPQAIPRPYYFHIENAGVNLPHIVDPVRPRRVIMETFAEPNPIVEGEYWRFSSSGRRKAYNCAKSDKVFHFEDAYIFSMNWWRNHYHFLVDSCSTYLQLKKYGAISPNTKLLSYGLPSRWQREYLEVLGIDSDTFFDVRDRCIKVRRLLIGSPSRHRFVPSMNAVDYLRHKILEKVVHTRLSSERKLYVTRRLADTRRIINEDEVAKFLVSEGFEIVEAESLTVVEKVKLFSEARTIVAPHGAGLANMIFSEKPDIIEFFAGDEFNRGYFITLTNILGGRHIPLVFEGQNSKNDYFVDLKKLMHYV